MVMDSPRESTTTTPDTRESRLCGTLQIGQTRSYELGRVAGRALAHMFESGNNTVYLRVDAKDDGDYCITYSPDPGDIPTDKPCD
jgi:hypothetical protein